VWNGHLLPPRVLTQAGVSWMLPTACSLFVTTTMCRFVHEVRLRPKKVSCCIQQNMNLDLSEFEQKMARQKDDETWTGGIKPDKGDRSSKTMPCISAIFSRLCDV